MADSGDTRELMDTTDTQSQDESASERVTAAEGLLLALGELEIEYLFVNLGTDHAPIIEAEANLGDVATIPELIVSPHESLAMSAAHGHALATGDPQVVLVHVDVGTLNIGAQLHSAYRSKAPVLVIAGLSPITEHSHPGSRDNLVHYYQDVYDQAGIVDDYCNWSYEYRIPADPSTVVRRGIEMAQGPPAGPTYLTASREALNHQVEYTAPEPLQQKHQGVPTSEQLSEIAELIGEADRPLVATTTYGESPAQENLEALINFAEVSGAGVVEVWPTCVNFPRTHELHAGFAPQSCFDGADLLLLLETDAPWLPSAGNPSPDCTVIQIDEDTTKDNYPVWNFPIDRSFRADARGTLAALADELDPAHGVSGRRYWSEFHDELRADWEADIDAASGRDTITREYLAHTLYEVVDDAAIIVSDVVTSTPSVLQHIPRSQPGTYFAKAGSGLGWANGGALGVKMGDPDSTVVCLAGDGSYVFGNPTAAAWMSVAHSAPLLTVVFNNHGWNAVRSSVEREHPDGEAIRKGVPGSTWEPSLDLSAPSLSVDAHAVSVTDPDELRGELEAALDAVHAGHTAVVDVHIE